MRNLIRTGLMASVLMGVAFMSTSALAKPMVCICKHVGGGVYVCVCKEVVIGPRA